jgi:hypothetical protein
MAVGMSQETLLLMVFDRRHSRFIPIHSWSILVLLAMYAKLEVSNLHLTSIFVIPQNGCRHFKVTCCGILADEAD